jgi:hypothetical protein
MHCYRRFLILIVLNNITDIQLYVYNTDILEINGIKIIMELITQTDSEC